MNFMTSMLTDRFKEGGGGAKPAGALPLFALFQINLFFLEYIKNTFFFITLYFDIICFTLFSYKGFFF